MEALKFVIVGEVDHGKSTLIGRLLYDTDSIASEKKEEIKTTQSDTEGEAKFAHLLDHLEEERRGGLTIDTTQVFFKTDKRRYVIIDAPGHVEFVRNMITGASQAEAAVLIIDVKEGVKEQTKRHAYILSLLGLNQVIVVLNKMDLVNFREESFNNVKKEVKRFLNSINIGPTFYIPICAIKGENIAKKSRNMSWYKGPTFLESLDELENMGSTEESLLVFPIQDVYKIDEKKIAVGRIEAGVIKEGDRIKILPSGRETEVKTIEKYLQDVKEAYVGESIGITTQEPVSLSRGDIICIPHKEPTLTDRFKANIFWMAERDFRKAQIVRLRSTTQEVNCRIENINKRIDSASFNIVQENASVLKNLEVGEVIINTERAIVVKTFNEIQELGRFVLIQDENICAGGIITAIA